MSGQKSDSMTDLRNPAHVIKSPVQVVASRSGQVLSRDTILKEDQFRSGANVALEPRIADVPNFRKTKLDLDIYAAAQASSSGIEAVLTMIGCSKRNKNPRKCIWISTREEPLIYINGRAYALREQEFPLRNLKKYTGVDAKRVEFMEQKLEFDVNNESKKHDGLILVHQEFHNGEVLPCWISASDVKTCKEIFERLSHNFHLEYYRIPITPEQAPEEKDLDLLASVVLSSNPESDVIVFNCQMGIGRSTTAMVVACLVRRQQMLSLGKPDPVPEPLKVSEYYERARTILRMTNTLQQALKKNGGSAIEWLISREGLVEPLVQALEGNYDSILNLLKVLDRPEISKSYLDRIIDSCDTLVNLRESILFHRVIGHADDKEFELTRALNYMQRYFSLIAFSSFILTNIEGGKMKSSFVEWKKQRHEIIQMESKIKRVGVMQSAFRPIEDLSIFHTKVHGAEFDNLVRKKRVGRVLGARMILKIDIWDLSSGKENVDTMGAPNFRKVPDAPIYGVAQPSNMGIINVLQKINGPTQDKDRESNKRLKSETKINWVNLREEPLIYINGKPFVLRDEHATLRNLTTFAGISADRLEELEQRLKEDVLTESAEYGGKILVHSDDANKNPIGVWEEVNESSVQTPRDVFESLMKQGYNVVYHRVPITAGSAPETTDFDDIKTIVHQSHLEGNPIVFNCQMGVGRSTLAQVIAIQVLSSYFGLKLEIKEQEKLNYLKSQYECTTSLIRTIKRGLEVKYKVDTAIDKCEQLTNIRESLHDIVVDTETHKEELAKKSKLRQATNLLKRYFWLIAFQGYLNEVSPDKWLSHTFNDWVSDHMEIQTMLKKVDESPVDALKPIHLLSAVKGNELDQEVMNRLENRHGSVLGKFTVLKSDHFPGCQKMSLTDKIEGAPNFRKIDVSAFGSGDDYSICGVAMPTLESIGDVIKRFNPNHKIYWTNLREEPTLYVKGRPYVLRNLYNPLLNIETTGITVERVEQMERQMKFDILDEAKNNDGLILLHGEEEKTFSLMPLWEKITPEDVLTCSEAFKSASLGKIDYLRAPVTDEQAPIPQLFEVLIERATKGGKGSDLIFNCQMGRGRTTTGMITSCLWVVTQSLTKGTFVLPEKQTKKDDPSQRYLDGDYKFILNLLRILRDGQTSKKLADYAIDTCSHIQNLREAIYQTKQRYLVSDAHDKPEALIRSVNYLIRYFYLIVYADYLLDRFLTMSEDFPKFSTWVSDRPEISNLIQEAVRDFN